MSRPHHWQLDPNFRTNPSGIRHGRFVPKAAWFDIHDKVNEIAANGFCGFGGGPGFSVTHGQIER